MLSRLPKVKHPARRAYILVCLVALVLAALPVQSTQAQTNTNKKYAFFAASDPAIYYFGRVKREVNTLWSWPGSGLRVVYNNSTSVTLRIFANDFWDESTHGMPKMVWYRIDHGAWLRFIVGAGTQNDVPLNVPKDTRPHQLDVMKASEGELTFEALLLDEFATIQSPTVPDRKFEFLGDSITAGYKVYNGQPSFEVAEAHDARASFAWQTGERLGAQVRLIAVTGRGLVHNFGVPPGAGKTLSAYYPMLIRETDATNDWGSWQPEVVVINAGTNDMTGPGATSPAAFQGAYLSLLTTVRQDNPSAFIIAMQPFGLRDGSEAVYPTEIQGAVAVRKASGDTRVAYLSTLGWLGVGDFNDGVHPNAGGQYKAAVRLSAAIPRLESQAQVAVAQAPQVTSNTSSGAKPVAPSSTASGPTCPGSAPTRLALGSTARVIVDGKGPSPILDQPGGKQIASAPEGTLLKIFDGPRCLGRSWFWLVYLPDGRAGWVSENYRQGYFIEPAG
jgi:lysophospholipase L1-like esterase